MTNSKLFRRDPNEVRFCTGCGRQLVYIEEEDGMYDPKTGKKAISRWLQCPKYPRNGFSALFSRTHNSLSVDNILIRKSWM